MNLIGAFRMARSRGICCSSDRTNDPALPVRYVPKITTKTGKPLTRPTPIETSTEKSMEKGLGQNGSRVEVANCRMVSQNSSSMSRNCQIPIQKPPQLRPITIDEYGKKVVKQGLAAEVVKFQAANVRAVSQNGFVVDVNFQDPDHGPSSGSTCASFQEAKKSIDHDELMEEPEADAEELGVHSEKSPLGQGLQACENKEDAEKEAIKLLATRAYTAVELRKKLHGKRFPTCIIDAVVMDFQIRGLINDCLYAESFARSRWSSSSWGPRRVKQALLKKGVLEVDAEKALKLVFQDGDPGGDQESSLGLSKGSIDHLYVQASKQWLRGGDVSIETRKSRIIRWLQYRGFSWGITSFILKKLESNHPS